MKLTRVLLPLLMLCAAAGDAQSLCLGSVGWGATLGATADRARCEAPSLFSFSTLFADDSKPVKSRRIDWDGLGEEKKLDVYVRSSTLTKRPEDGDGTAPSEGAVVAGLDLRLGSGWTMETSVGSAHQLGGKKRAPILDGGALRWKIGGLLGGFRLEAGFQDIGDAFSDPTEKKLRKGRQTHLAFERNRDAWRVSGRFSVDDGGAVGPVQSTELRSQLRLPAGLQSKVELRARESADGGGQMERRVELTREWSSWHLAVADTRAEREPTLGRAIVSDRLTTTVRFNPDPQWSLEGGSVLEQSDVTSPSRTLFLRPSWQASGSDLRLGFKLAYDSDRRVGGILGDGFGGETTLRWKASGEEGRGALAFDLSWKELEDSLSTERLTERKATVKLELRL